MLANTLPRLRNIATKNNLIRYYGTAVDKSAPLAGMKVLDLTTALAGPSCTMYLADLGAEVIKLEIPNKGDDSRNWGPPFLEHAPTAKTKKWTQSVNHESTYYLGTNRNKKSITVNLKTQEGVDIAKKIAAESDVFVENFVSGKLPKLGLGYEDIKAINPSIIYASITGYGQNGPYKTTPGYDAVVGAESGIVHATGEPDRAPVRPGIPITDLNAGFYTTISIIASYVKKIQSGEGVYIDVSMFDCQVATMKNLASSWLNAGIEAIRVGTGHNNLAPYQVFKTKDSYLMLGVGNDVQFAKFSECVGKPEWAQNPKFKTNKERVLNKVELTEMVTDIMATKPNEEWHKIFSGNGFPFGNVNNMEQVFNHPQAKFRELVHEAEHPLVGKTKVVGPAVMFNGKRMKVRKVAPGLGEDTQEVLNGLGLTNEQIKGLKDKGIL